MSEAKSGIIVRYRQTAFGGVDSRVTPLDEAWPPASFPRMVDARTSRPGCRFAHPGYAALLACDNQISPQLRCFLIHEQPFQWVGCFGKNKFLPFGWTLLPHLVL
jgi:hypothetical protein